MQYIIGIICRNFIRYIINGNKIINRKNTNYKRKWLNKSHILFLYCLSFDMDITETIKWFKRTESYKLFIILYTKIYMEKRKQKFIPYKKNRLKSKRSKIIDIFMDFSEKNKYWFIRRNYPFLDSLVGPFVLILLLLFFIYIYIRLTHSPTINFT